MVAAIIFAQFWGVVQLIILATPARTVRIRTVFAAMAVGFYLLGPVTAFLQLSWIHLAAALFGMSADDLQRIASHTFDPFLEEALKLLPLALLMRLPSIRRQWSITDCLLIAAATGSGFGLAEEMFRYAAYPHTAHEVAGGWTMPVGTVGAIFVPGFFRTITSWIPSGAYLGTSSINVNYHLAWSSIAGLAFALILHRRTRKALAVGIALFVLIGLDHAATNSQYIGDNWLTLVSGPLNLVTLGLGVFTLTGAVLAWWLDQPAQRAGLALGPRMAAEESASSPPLGTLIASLSRFPWSLPWVYGFDRERRAFHAAHATAVEGRDAMLSALVAKRDALEVKLKETSKPPLLPAWLNKDAMRREVRRALRSPPVVMWLVLISPSVLFLIVGGFPQTAWLQRLLTASVMWPLTLLITVIGYARIALRVCKGIKQLPATLRLPIGDDAAVLSLQLACGIGAVTLGGFTLGRVLSGVGARDHLFSAHAADAVQRATPGSAAATAASASAAAGPGTSGSPSSSSNSDSSSSSAGKASASSGTSNSGGDGSPNPYLNRIPPLVAPAPNPNPLPPPPPPPMDDPGPPPPSDEYGPPRPSDDDDTVAEPDPTPPGPRLKVPPAPPPPDPLPPPPPPPPDYLPSYDDIPLANRPAPVENLPNAPQPDSVPIEEVPEAPQPRSTPVEDLPDAPQPKSVPVEDLPDAPQSNPTPPVPKASSPQQLADQAADRAAQAQADADAAHQAATHADTADESAWIRSQTTDPSSAGKAAADAAHAAANQADAAAKAASDRAAAAQAAADKAQASADAAAAKAANDAAAHSRLVNKPHKKP